MTWREGHRIVDMCELARQMNCTECGSLLDLNRTKGERRAGLASVLYVGCQCGVMNQIHTSKKHSAKGMRTAYLININATIGVQRCKLITEQACKFLRGLGIPATKEIFDTSVKETITLNLDTKFPHVKETCSTDQPQLRCENDPCFEIYQAGTQEDAGVLESNNILHDHSYGVTANTLVPTVKSEEHTDELTSVKKSQEAWRCRGHSGKRDVREEEDLPDLGETNVLETQIPFERKREVEIPKPVESEKTEHVNVQRGISHTAHDNTERSEEKERKTVKSSTPMESDAYSFAMPLCVIETTGQPHTDTRNNPFILDANKKNLPPFPQANHRRTCAQRRGIKMYVVNDLCAPFKCGECGARFALAKALTIHKKVHCNGFSNLIIKSDGQEHSVKNDETQREDAQKRDDETSKESDIKFQETTENINCRSIKQTDSSQKESCPPANDPCIAGDMQTSESEAMCDVFKSAQIEDQPAESCEDCCAGEKCKKCRATFSLSSTLEKHLKAHLVERLFPCLECSAKFSKKRALKNHMARIHAKRKTFSCPECLVTLSTSNSLKNHIRIHTGEKPFQCEICKKLFRECSALRKHYMRTHSGTLSHVCQDCGKSFPFVYELNQHRIIHTGQKTHTCQECKATFTYARSLALHMRIHTDERSFSCEICQKSFRQSSHLKAHLRTHSKERSFLCEDCGKTFASKDYLVVHYRTHTGERPYKCPSCPASYSQRGCLHHHMRIHTGEMFLCDICQKSFRSLQYLKEHKNIHSGEKFLCQDCGKTFFSKLRLQTHQKIHEGSSDNKTKKTFSCELCSTTFTLASNLYRHKKIHMGIKPYSCVICHKPFRDPSCLKTHMRVHSKN